MRFLNPSSHNQISNVLIALLAIALQIQISLFVTADYDGLRINLADLFLPFAGLYVLYSLLSGKSQWPRWHVKHMIWGLLGLLGVMSVALLHGYIQNGVWSSWALINKYIGFLLLLSYFGLASWMATNMPNDIKDTFARAFCYAFIFIIAISLGAVILQPFVSWPLWIGDYPWDGLMANRNAFIVSMVFVMLLLSVYSVMKKPLISVWCYAFFWTMVPIFSVYNGSRAGWIVISLALLSFLFKNPSHFFKKILPYLLIGTILAYAILMSVSSGKVKRGNQLKSMVSVIQQGTGNTGDRNRLLALEDGMALYQKSNPVLGAGLGSYKPFQIEKRGEFIDIIDWTALWLLVETGALGLFSFSAFFLLCLYVFYQKGIKEAAPYHASLFFFLILLIGMSFLHELLYTRFLWFALGLGMAIPVGRVR